MRIVAGACIVIKPLKQILRVKRGREREERERERERERETRE